MTIGERIKAAREKANQGQGLTQKQLGELCGINEANLRKYESGRQNPKLSTLQKIADALNIPMSDLLGMESVDKYGDMAALEKNLLQCGCSLGYDEEDAILWINFPDGALEVTEKELTDLQNEVVDYLRFKLVELRKKHDADFRKTQIKKEPPSPYFF